MVFTLLFSKSSGSILVVKLVVVAIVIVVVVTFFAPAAKEKSSEVRNTVAATETELSQAAVQKCSVATLHAALLVSLFAQGRLT